MEGKDFPLPADAGWSGGFQARQPQLHLLSQRQDSKWQNPFGSAWAIPIALRVERVRDLLQRLLLKVQVTKQPEDAVAARKQNNCHWGNCKLCLLSQQYSNPTATPLTPWCNIVIIWVYRYCVIYGPLQMLKEQDWTDGWILLEHLRY